MSKNLFFAGFMTETNTFSPIPATLKSFEEFGLLRPNDKSEKTLQMAKMITTPLDKVVSEASGWEMIVGTQAYAQPSGPIARKANYESLRDEILAQLKEADSVEAVSFLLHGSMMADGYDDCEGDILTKARQIVGPDIPVGVVLDPHCHLSDAMVNNTDMIILMKEYPHTDIMECLERLVEILISKVEKGVNLCHSIFDCRQITLYRTDLEPMLSFVKKMRLMEKDDDVLSISVVHGFPWGDNAYLGTKVLATTNNNPKKADQITEELGKILIVERENFTKDFLPLSEGFDKAQQFDRGPIVIADIADNPGGGAGGDSTYILKEMIERKMFDACIGNFWDPVAVKFCKQVGEGAMIDLRIGGKVGVHSGMPVDLRVKVIKIKEDAYDFAASVKAPLGTLVGLRSEEGLELVINDLRSQNRSPTVFTDVGIDPVKKRFVVVKSTNLFYEKYAPIAKEILFLDTPGALVSDLTLLNFHKRPKPLWPFEKDV